MGPGMPHKIRGESYMKFMESIGFSKGVSSPCCFWHKIRDMRAVVHGDDFPALGWKKELMWFRCQIEKEYEVKFRGMIGPGAKEGKEMRILVLVLNPPGGAGDAR